MEKSKLQLGKESAERYAAYLITNYYEGREIKTFYCKEFLTVIIPMKEFELLNQKAIESVFRCGGSIYITERQFLNVELYFIDFI